jgi:predicted nuclease with RNAse H fold
MKVVGIDLSGPRNIADTCMAIFDDGGGELHFAQAVEAAGDRQIFEAITRLSKNERVIVGIDAPLSYNPGGGDRESDRELRKLVNKQGGVGVMAPTMMRMVYLTLRGIALTRMLESLERRIEIVEVHPGAGMLLRDAPPEDVKHFKHAPSARVHLCAWLETRGLKGLPSGESQTDHFVAACAAALGAWGWAKGNPVWRHPARPPEHPYDFAC